MPVSEKPRKKYNPSKHIASTKGAWDQLHEMISNAKSLLSIVPDSGRLLLERKKLGGNFDEDRAKAVLSVLLKDITEMKNDLTAIENQVGTNRGDIKEDDEQALMLTLRLGGQLSAWTERWQIVVQPQLDEINKIVVAE